MKIELLEEYCHFTPTEKQKVALEKKERFILFGGAVGGSKTAWLAAFTYAHCLSFPKARALVGRRFFVDFEKTTWLEFEKWQPRKGIKKFDKREVVFNNASKIFFTGFDSNEKSLKKLSGYELSLFAIDQADEVSEKVFHTLSARLRLVVPNIEYHGILTCNPGPHWLRERFLDRRLPEHTFVQSLPSDNPYLPAGYIESLKLSLPEELVEVWLKGDFYAIAALQSLFSINRIEKAMERKAVDGEICYGIDVGRGGEETVIAKKNGNRLSFLDSFVEGDLTKACERCAKVIGNKNARVKVDGIGPGAALIGILRNSGFKNVIEIIGNRLGGRQFVNEKSKNYHHLALVFDKISIPKDEQLKSQLLNARERVTPDRRFQIETRAEMKLRSVQAPNRLDAIVMALADEPVSDEEAPQPFVFGHPLFRFLRGLKLGFGEVRKKIEDIERKRNQRTPKQILEQQIRDGYYSPGRDPDWVKEKLEVRRKAFDKKAREEDEEFLHPKDIKYRKY